MDSLRENYASPLVRKGYAASLYRNKIPPSLNNSVLNNNSLLLNTSSNNNNYKQLNNSKNSSSNAAATTSIKGSSCHSLLQNPPTVSVQLASFVPNKDIKVSLSLNQPQSMSKSQKNNINDSARRLYSDLLESSIQSIYESSMKEQSTATIASSISGLDYIKDLYSNNHSFEEPSFLNLMEDQQPEKVDTSKEVEQTQVFAVSVVQPGESKHVSSDSVNNPTDSSNNANNSSLLADTAKQDINGVDELILFSPLSNLNETTSFDIDLSNESDNDLFDSLSYLTNYKNINLLNLTNCHLNINSLVIPFKEIKFIKILNLSNNGLVCNDIKCLCENLKQNTTLQELILSNNSISNKGVVSIGKFLTEKNNLKKLHINNNKFTILGCKALCYGMMLNTTLNYLNLSNNNLKVSRLVIIYGTKSLKNCHFIINQLMQYSNNLKCIEMNECELFSNEYYFTFNNTININILNLESNNLGDFITKNLFSTLAINTSVHTIYLKNNNITDECTNTITLCLKNNSKLLYLDLSENKLSSHSTLVLNEICNILKKKIVILTNNQLVCEEHEEENQSTYSYVDSESTEFVESTHCNSEPQMVNESNENPVQVIEEEIYSADSPSISIQDAPNPSLECSVHSEESMDEDLFIDILNGSTTFPIINDDNREDYDSNETEEHQEENGENEEERVDDDSVFIECEKEEESDEDHLFVNEEDIVGTFLSNIVPITNSYDSPITDHQDCESNENHDQYPNHSFLNSALDSPIDLTNNSSLSGVQSSRKEGLNSLSKIRDQYISPMKKPSSMNLSFSQLMKQLNY